MQHKHIKYCTQQTFLFFKSGLLLQIMSPQGDMIYQTQWWLEGNMQPLSESNINMEEATLGNVVSTLEGTA